jgi:hypothetical protein
MYKAIFRLMMVWITAAAIGTQSFYAQGTKAEPPRVFLADAERLRDIKQSIQAKDKPYEAAVAQIEAEARKAIKEGTYSVTSKVVVPPSGDKHDYMSQAPYFWPDPTKKDGLPYIRKDGERNPEINKITDHKTLDDMVGAVENLSLAYYFRGNEAYAAKAVTLLRAWFLDPATRMNPNMEYAQYVPGVNKGRGIGLLETRGLTRAVDAIGLLEGSKSLMPADKRGIEDWFTKFVTWMQENKNGKEESASQNNHGTYYDVQLTSFALFIGKNDLAKSIVETAKTKRIARQIEPDGSQPLELARTKGWSYSIMNLEGLITLAGLADHVGVDLWSYQTKDGRGIRKAFDFLFPYSQGEKWKYQQIGDWPSLILFPVMRRASAKYADTKFKTMMAKVPAASNSDKENLLYSEKN